MARVRLASKIPLVVVLEITALLLIEISVSQLVYGELIESESSKFEASLSQDDSTESLSRTKRASSSTAGSTAGEGSMGNLVESGFDGAKCLVERDPNFKDYPNVHFYSARVRSRLNESANCNNGLKFVLNFTEWLEDDYSDDNNGDRSNEELQLKERLFDTGLYNGSLETYFIVHGFLASWSSSPWMCQVKDLILANSGDANVFIVDWSGGAKPMLPIDYSLAVNNANPVAKILSELVKKLIKLSGQSDASSFQFIGHSLGAQISGFVGYLVGGSLGRITALDPAGPCFTSTITTGSDQETVQKTGELGRGRRRLSQSSALYVIALHTDTSLFGLNEDCAHVDVYPNGGSDQPGCPSGSFLNRFGNLLRFRFSEALSPRITCSHSFVHDLVDVWVSDPEGGEQDEDKCYPMAYECPSWRTFIDGECGTCKNADSDHCTYAGLTARLGLPDQSYHGKDTRQAIIEEADNRGPDPNFFANPDLKANGEQRSDVDSNGDAGDKDKSDSAHHSIRYYMRTSKNQPSCLYHYQIVVGTERPISASTKFYLYIPLAGTSKKSRRVTISHQFASNTSRLVDDIMTMNQLQDRSMFEDVTFYSALITFDQLSNCNSTAGSSSSSDRSLCRPVSNFDGVRLTVNSSGENRLIRLLAINYMNGLSLETRSKLSHLMISRRRMAQRARKAQAVKSAGARETGQARKSGQIQESGLDRELQRYKSYGT